ncbi:mitochondrial import receptor subunit Tom20p [[Candida] anglica]|uniref:Mitochondrial import receptor subunit Tom20p n=1 Tax=[Candida] anglica TaxID=148631 RepID=A0ABP0EBN9_9ASCO
MSKALTFTAIAATALVGYAVYFDYSRRNSAEFRKSLKKKAVKHEKNAAKKDEQSKKSKLELVKLALAADLEANPIPTDLSEKENFFMQQVALGEQLGSLPNKKIDAAICFYKALAVYPNPTDILGIYQRSVPEDVYELVVMMIAVQPPAAVTNILGGGVSGASSAAAAAAAANVPVEEQKPSEEDLD